MAADVFDQLVALLNESKAKFRVIEHEAEGRSEAISVIRGNRPDQAAKAMVLDVRGGGAGKRHVLAILPGNRKLDFSCRCKTVRGAQMRLRLARHRAGADRLRHGLGAAVFAQSRRSPSWSKRTCSANDTLFFNAGRLDRSMELDTKDWLAVARPRVARIAANMPERDLQVRHALESESGAIVRRGTVMRRTSIHGQQFIVLLSAAPPRLGP